MEDSVEQGNSLAAPTVFIIVFFIQFLPRYLEHHFKGGTLSETELKLRAEIRELLKEASAYSQPSTFAQAAKLRRIAAAKEKELAKIQEVQMKERKSSYDPYMKAMMPIKILTYFVLAIWFWGSPVAAISKELVQPFGKVLSWKAGVFADDKVMVGILPWMILSTRVSKLICRKVIQ
ncbi:GET1-like protein [Drosera capensis]